MRRRLQGPIAVIVLGIVLTLCCAVGSPRPAPPESRAATEYANAYKNLMVAYRDAGIKIMSRPRPPQSAPKAQRRAAVLKQLEDMAAMNRQCAQRLNRLRPPAAFREIQVTTALLFTVSELGNLRWAQAIRSGNREAQHRALQEMETAEAKALTNMQQALKRAGGNSEKLNAVVREYQQAIKAH